MNFPATPVLHQNPKLTLRVDKLNLMMIEERHGFFDPLANTIKIWRSAAFHQLLDVAAMKKVTGIRRITAAAPFC
jgi:hypothetical protein